MNSRSSLTMVLVTVVLFAVCEIGAQQAPPSNGALYFQNSRFIGLTFQTDAEKVIRMVPKPLVPDNPGIVNLDIGLQKKKDGGMYNEAFVQIPVKMNGKSAMYMAWNLVDDSAMVKEGKNDLGLARKFAQFKLTHYMNKLYYQVFVDGKEFAVAEYTMGEQGDPRPQADKLIYGMNSKGLLGSFLANDFMVTKNFVLQGSLKTQDVGNASIPYLPVHKVITAYYYECDFAVQTVSDNIKK